MATAAALLLALAGGAACSFSPDLGNGILRCGAGDGCPPGQHCERDGLCHQQGGDAGSGGDLGGCAPLHCENGWCGPVIDACGHTLDCGSCEPLRPDLAVADLAGIDVDLAAAPPDLTLAPDLSCAPTSACAPGVCGSIDDGCGTRLRCGDCPGDTRACSETEPNRCTCVPRTCPSVGATCGRYPSGCNLVILNCGTCPSGTCGGGGPYTCGDTMTCSPLTVCPPRACGPLPDGCNGILRCGGCAAPQVCGGGGKPNVCG